MKKLFANIHAKPLVCLAVAGLLMGGSGCASNKAGMSAPELPARHWLDDAPGIPIENKDKYDAAVPNLYKPNKKFGYEDCVYLTIQQSPALVNSAVNIEIKRLAQTSAAWKYLPEPHMTLTVSQNLTMKNMDTKNTEGEYGKTQVEVGFYAPFPNPVATYFEHKAQGMMTGIAIATHRKAVGEAIYKIAEAYLCLQAKQYSLAAQKSLVPVARELTDYWRQMENVAGNQGASLSMSQQHLRENELAVEKATMEETLQRTQLKMLAGVEASQKFEIDASHAYQDILKGFDGKSLNWEKRWNETEDNLILRTQIQLSDFNIMLQWAQYVPNMRFAVNMNPPRGQSQPSNGTPDEFLHFTFDFPLIDWGRRYRDVQTARMGKAQAFHSLAQKRSEYQNKWLEAEQNANLALTNLKLAQNRYKTAQMQYEVARISFENGMTQLPDVANRQEAMVQQQINYINTELEYRLAELKWMYVAGLLQEHFLGLPSVQYQKQLRPERGASGNRALGIKDDSATTPVKQSPDADKPVFGGYGRRAPAADAGTPHAASAEEPAAAPSRTASRPIGRVRPAKLPPLPEGSDASASGAAAAVPDTGSRPVGRPADDLKTSPSL